MDGCWGQAVAETFVCEIAGVVDFAGHSADEGFRLRCGGGRGCGSYPFTERLRSGKRKGRSGHAGL